MRIAAYRAIQATWGIIQTLAGLCILAANARKPHHAFHGAIVTSWRSRFSLSLGMFVFVGENSPYCDITRTDIGRYDERLLVHEYGHTVQSLVFGPLYLLVIGLPSLIWARSRRLSAKHRSAPETYYDFFTERWANSWGEKALHRPSMR